MRKYETGTAWCVWRWTTVDSEYITRLHLLKTPWFALCFHWLNKADPEPYLHDHPVSFFSIILRGGYVEQREHTVKARHHFNFVRATDKHSIFLVQPGTLTFCLMGPKVRNWGFTTPEGWVYWRDYYRDQRAGVKWQR